MTRTQAPMIASRNGYLVTPDGSVVSPAGKRLKLLPRADGRLQFSVRNLCKCKVHLLQAWQKFGEAMFAPGIEVRHLDGNYQNNSDNNIEIGTKSQNAQDKPRAVRIRVAALANLQHDHAAILAHYRESGSYAKTMEAFRLTSKGTLNFIIRKSMAQQALLNDFRAEEKKAA